MMTADELRPLLVTVLGMSKERATKMVNSLSTDPELLEQVANVTLAVQRSGEAVDRARDRIVECLRKLKEEEEGG